MKLEKALEEGRAKVTEKATRSPTTCTNVGFIQQKKNGEFVYVDDDNSQCHIGLRYGARQGAPKYIISSLQRRNAVLEKDDAKIKRELLDYFFPMIKAHPVWGPPIINETPQDVWDNCWVFRTDYPRNALCSSVFATRWITEFPANCYAAKILHDNGAEADIAFVASLVLGYDFNKDCLVKRVPAGHMPCYSGATKKFAISFLKGDVREPGKDFYEKSSSYSGINTVFKGSEDYEGDYMLSELAKFVGKDMGWSPTKDIFFTEEYFLKLRKRKEGVGLVIEKEQYAKVAKGLNKLKKELIQ